MSVLNARKEHTTFPSSDKRDTGPACCHQVAHSSFLRAAAGPSIAPFVLPPGTSVGL